MSSKSMKRARTRTKKSIKEEYERLGIKFSFGVPGDDVQFQDNRIGKAEWGLYDSNSILEELLKRIGDKEMTELEKQFVEQREREVKKLEEYVAKADEIHKVFDYRSAVLALEHFNAEHKLKFQVVECLGSVSKLYGGKGRHTHTNFLAKQPGDVNTTLFFAELLGRTPPDGEQDERRVTWCQIVDESRMVRRCKICKESDLGFVHPEGFKNFSWLKEH